jgi:hypothetical protein
VTKGEISFRLPTSGGGDALHAQDWASESVRSDGSFRCRWALQVGTYTVDVAKRKIERPQQVTIAGDRDEQLVDVVVAKIDAADAISGIVVDDRDQPVSGAMVFYSPMPDGHGYVNSTDRDGHFQISRPDHGTADEVTLSLFREDYDAIPSTTKYAWGRSDVRLVMRGGLDVELTVVDGDNKPVEIFRARVVPMYTAGGTFGREYPGASGTHAGGHAVIHRITRGSQLVTVEPPAESPLAQACVVVDVADPGPALVGVQLSRRAERTLRLQRADGSAVVGAAVQLADPLGQPFTTQTPCYPLEDWSRTSAAKALQLQTAVTDAQGETLLSGPGGRALALLLPGPKHVPTTIADVHLDEATPLVVTVITGARVTGRVGPAAALVELRRLAELPLTGALPARTRQAQPGIVLARGEGTSAEVFPDRMSSMPIDADGSFAFDGAPPGRWQVSVAFAVAHSSSGMMSMSIGNREPGPVVDLSDGATTDVAIDLSSILPGELDGVVLRNGKPLANTAVRAGTKFAVAVTTDADGRFHATLRAGECELTWPRGQPPNWSSLRAAETINIVTGQTVAQTFHLDSGTVRVRVLDPHGNPAAKVRIELRDAAGTPRQSLPPTGDDGSTTAEIEAETLAASALPKRLQEWPAQQAYWVANPGNPDPLASQRLQLGSITARAGDTIEVELRLPADWER